MSSYDPAELVRVGRIAEDYQFKAQGRLSDDEAMQCVTCGFRSRLDGTPVFVWVRVTAIVPRPIIELCEICNAAGGGPAAV